MKLNQRCPIKRKNPKLQKLITNAFGKKVKLDLNLGLMPNSDVLIRRVSRFSLSTRCDQSSEQKQACDKTGDVTLLATSSDVQHACHVTNTAAPLQPCAALVTLGRMTRGLWLEIESVVLIRKGLNNVVWQGE